MQPRRAKALQVAFAWISAVGLFWIALLLLLINDLAMTHYEKTRGGMPLPWATEVSIFPTSLLYWFPIPAIIFAIFSTVSDKLSNHDGLCIAGICLVVGIVAISTIVFGTLLPAIPY